MHTLMWLSSLVVQQLGQGVTPNEEIVAWQTRLETVSNMADPIVREDVEWGETVNQEVRAGPRLWCTVGQSPRRRIAGDIVDYVMVRQRWRRCCPVPDVVPAGGDACWRMAESTRLHSGLAPWYNTVHNCSALSSTQKQVTTTTMIPVQLPEPLFQRLKRAAEFTHRSVEEIAATTLEAALPLAPDMSPEIAHALTAMHPPSRRA